MTRQKFLQALCLSALAPHATADPIHRKLLRVVRPGAPRTAKQTYHADPELTLEERSVTVFAFENVQQASPIPPEFGRFLSLELMQDLGPERVSYKSKTPWSDWLEHRAAALTESQKRELMSASAETDFVACGRLIHAIPGVGGGAKVEAEVTLLGRDERQTLWFGSKRIEWKKTARVEDAMAYTAKLFSREWR